MSPIDIDDLARKASSGDERALSKIFRDFHRPLYRYCLAILGNRQDAEDALQETMVKVLRALPGEQRKIALKPWLYRIAHNESIDLLRRRRASVSLEEDESAAGEGLAEQMETRQRLRQLIVDLGALPERQRGVLLMREAAGLDFEEIASALETSPAVARQTLYEARLGLRQMDAGRDMDCTAVTKALSDGDRRVRRRRDIRAHLRDCSSCRQFAEEIDSRRGDLAAISPLPAVAAAALLHGALGGGAGAGATAAGGTGSAGASGGFGGLLGGAATKSVGTATLLKGAAAAVVVAAIGVGAADRGGLIHIGSHDPAPTVRSGTGDGNQTTSGAATPRSAESRVDSAGDPSTQSGLQSSIGAARAAPPGHDNAAAKNAGPAPRNSPPNTSSGGAGSGSPGKSGVEHPHGRAHAKQTPAAAAHGQETAADNKPEKTSGSGSPGASESGGSKPADTPHPVHPTHPTHPAKPASPAGPSSAAGPPAKPEDKRP